MTSKNNVQKALAVNATWATRCNKYVFVTPNMTTNLPALEFNIKEGRDHLWEKTKKTFKWIYDNELENYDWFLKADDDTYVVMENLRFMLLAYSPDDPLYFGCKFRPIVEQGYMSGGAGYILGRKAVKKFVEEALPDYSKCKNTSEGNEDVEIGSCLQNVGIKGADTRDHNGKHRILPFSPGAHLEPNVTNSLPPGFLDYMYYPYKQGPDCCSDYMISFHYVDRKTMFLMDNLLYHIRPIGSSDDILETEFHNKEGKSVIDTLKDLALKTSQPQNPNEQKNN